MLSLDSDAAAEARYQRVAGVTAEPGELDVLFAALADESWRVRRLAAEKLALLPTSTPGLIDGLVQRLARRGEPGVRNAAALALGRLGPAVAPLLLPVLSGADADAAKFAAEILGEVGAPEALPGLCTALGHSDLNVRVAAGEAVARLGGPRARAALEALLAAPEPALRVVALEGLAALDAAPALLALGPHLRDPATRRSALRVLGAVQHPAAERLLCEALTTASARQAALEALGRHAQPLPPELSRAVRRALRDPDAVEAVERALASDEPRVQRGALLAAHALRAPGLVSAVAHATVGPNVELGRQALLALGPAGLVGLLSGPVPAVLGLPPDARAVVEDVLCEVAEPSLVEPLVALASAAEADGLELALRVLGHTGSAAAVPVLVGALADVAVGPLAARALVTLGGVVRREVEAALEPLVAGAPPPDAVRAFALLERERAAEQLKRALHDESAHVRAVAVECAWVLGAGAEAFVRAGVVDESPLVRLAAARALGAVPADVAAQLVPRVLHDDTVGVVAAACRACADALVVGQVPALRRLVRHPDETVSLAAFEALAWLGGLDDDALEVALRGPPELLVAVLALTAERPATAAAALAGLSHARWEVRAEAARCVAVAAPHGADVALRRALRAEADDVVREALGQALAALEKRAGEAG